MYVNPQFRGYQSLSGIKITKTIDRAVPQSQWNLDRADGSNSPFNPSGYLLVPTKMNMVCLQWTWYGAGFIDWMIRGPEGKYITVHRLRNNNLNNEAWMRAGNLPVRYEVQNESARTYTVGSATQTGISGYSLGASDSVMTVNDSTLFPVPVNGYAQTVFVDNEVITYTGKINTYATTTSSTGNVILVASTTNMAIGQPIVFTNAYQTTSLGNLATNTTYYILSITTFSGTIGGATYVSAPAITVASTYANYGTSTVMTQTNATSASLTANLQINALTGLSRSQSITPWASGGQRTFSAGSAATHVASTGVILINGTASPIVSHWGAAFIEDGGFDSDRSYIFNYQATNVALSTKKTTSFAIRLAPSVSNALPGDLGARELINRASFLLQQLESSSGSGGTNAALVIEGIINPSNMPGLTNISFNSLNSVANPTGQPSFSQVAPGNNMVFTNSVNNFLTVPLYVPAGSYYVPTTSNPANSSPAVNVGDDIYFPGTTGGLYGLTRVQQLLTYSPTFTSTIAVGTTATLAGCTISGTTLSTTGVTGTAVAGMVLTGTGVPTGLYIVALLTGSGTGGPSTFTVSQSVSLPNPTNITGTPYTMTVSASPSAPILPGALLSGGSIAANTWVSLQLTNTGAQAGYQGTYALVNPSGTSITGSMTPTGATYYGVYTTQPMLTGIYGTGQSGYTVNISRGTYALPGETVFSYINSPANKDALDLSNLKELTNTPIGGRGAYPNGCDILFINAYITQGSPINQNLVLRWGEAQA
jgi:hypothetical protein